ncbi:type III pantothenate kinase [Haliea sp. E1-2-M8]|uniref:type III pantothenate kinase n=1 Tax=Haliea sp. E1-2-M8 TaxID=3064706 RepID=UPI0027270B85|nr:type III pantothenate kinase [Haliea sp. E1-2-M8]MDO8863387.1 type III pantothenate kinase [Haliea sp. E1-2-M8]
MSATLCLQFDVGNSSAKWRLMAGAEVLARGVYRREDEDSRTQLLACSDVVDRIWIASVASEEAEWQLGTLLEERWQLEPWFARSEARTGTLVNSYQQPLRMGVDRWLAMLGAWHRRPDRLCVVDAGSALTIDLVDASGQHEGGYIIPGPSLMERALLLDTDRVRFAEEAVYDLAPGTSTAEAVRHGIALAQAAAVRVAMEQSADPQRSLYLCGGGAETLQRLLGGAGEWIPDLVFEGLEVMAAEHGLDRGFV